MGELDDFNYAIDQTRVVVPPEKRLDTFGSSVLNYFLVTEDMDSVNLARVREGRIEAERPELLTADTMARLMIDGFGDKAQQFADVISANAERFAFLKYGFRIRRDDIRTYEVHEPIEQVLDKVSEDVRKKEDPLAAVVAGVDDAWEVCLLKFMLDFINSSGPGNVDDLRRKGLL